MNLKWKDTGWRRKRFKKGDTYYHRKVGPLSMYIVNDAYDGFSKVYNIDFSLGHSPFNYKEVLFTPNTELTRRRFTSVKEAKEFMEICLRQFIDPEGEEALLALADE
jgi:hypothetical protein